MNTEELEFEVWWHRIKSGRAEMETLHLIAICGLSLKEAAEELGISEREAAKRLRIAKRKLAATCLSRYAAVRAARMKKEQRE